MLQTLDVQNKKRGLLNLGTGNDFIFLQVSPGLEELPGPRADRGPEGVAILAVRVLLDVLLVDPATRALATHDILVILPHAEG